jgi:hypothetical protein
VNIIGDVLGTAEQAVADPAEALAGALDGSAWSAPVPSVRSRPTVIAAARAWSAPEAGGGGQVTVHRDVLRGVSVGMRSDLRDLDGAVSGLGAAGHGVSSIAGWQTAVAFSGNAANAYDSVLRASQQAGNAHQATSRRLGDSAATYDQAEADSRQAIYSVGTHLGAVTGMVASPGSRLAASASAAASAGGATAVGYPVKTNAVAPFSGTGMSASQIMAILHGLDPGAVQDAGEAHTSLGTTLDEVAARLVKNAHTLAQNWSGTAAQAAMGQFQQLHDHTAVLAQQALQVGAVLTWLGRDVLPSFKTLPDPSVSLTSLVMADAATGAAVGGALGGPAGGVAGGLIGGATGAVDSLLGVARSAADKTAQGYIEALSESLVTANNALPPIIGGTGAPGSAAGGARGGLPGTGVLASSAGGAVLAPGAAGAGSRAGTAGGTGGTSGTSGTGGAGTAGTGSGRAGLRGTGTADAGSVGAPSSSPVPSSAGRLQSAPVPGGTVDPSAVGPSTVSPPAINPSTVSPAAIPVTGSLVPGVSGLNGLGGGSASSAAGDDPAAAGDDPAAPELPVASPDSGLSGVVPGVPGVPGQGAAAAGAVADSAVADSAVADSPVADGAVTDGAVGIQPISTDGSLAAGTADGTVAPGMAGFPMAGAGGPQQEQERRRKAWLDEEADIWGLPTGLVAPVVEGGG